MGHIIPEGYEIDTKKSTFTNIVFKKIESWIENIKKNTGILIGYSIKGSKVTLPVGRMGDINIFPTEKHAKSAKAYALISYILRYDDRFGGGITNGEWADGSVAKYTICRSSNHLNMEELYYSYTPIAFRTIEQRALFRKENEQLLKDYFMID